MATSKYDWRKEDKQLYLPPTKPVLLEVPPLNFIMVDGRGDPNTEPFQDCMSILYGLSWTIKMLPKSGQTPPGYYEYGVFPLEGVWSQDSDSWQAKGLSKDDFIYTVMIRQPDFVNQELFEQVRQIAAKKKKMDFSAARLASMTDGLSVQMTHVGPYDDEPASFAQMQEFMEANGLRRLGNTHREIYMGDPRKGDPAKLKTVLRYFVEKI